MWRCGTGDVPGALVDAAPPLHESKLKLQRQLLLNVQHDGCAIC